MVQDDHCDFVATGVRWGGAGSVDGAAGERERGHDLGARAGRGGMLGGDLSAVAEADVDLRGGA